MRDLVLMLVLLAACESPSLVAVPAERWQPTSSDQQATARSFAQVSEAVADAVGREYRRRSRSASCESASLVVLNPRAPENAFQILDKVSRPQFIFTQPMILNSAVGA